MEFTCCLKSCVLDRLDEQSARVEVKSALPEGGLANFSNVLFVRWKRNGEAVFHPECWNNLLTMSGKNARSRRRKTGTVKRKAPSGVNSFHMTDSEKAMIQEASKTKEIFDSEKEVRQQAERVATLIKEAKHCVIFTGAGISTSAGLGDFRGKGGKWTEEDRESIPIFTKEEEDSTEQGLPPAKRARSVGKKNASSLTTKCPPQMVKTEMKEEAANEEELDYECLRPTFTHEAIRKLIEDDCVKYIISQNCDGLHLLSGVPACKISELHGNVFMEKCEQCNTRYERSYYVCDDVSDIYLEELADFGRSNVIVPKFMKRCSKCGLSHRTGRQCEIEGCKGQLIDSIINFYDDLDQDILDKAFASAKSCDLLLCLGTTLTVTPACNIVYRIKQPRRVVICNRQATEKDKESMKVDRNGIPLGARVYSDCDVFMKYVMMYLLGEEKFSEFKSSLSCRRDIYEKQRSIPNHHGVQADSKDM